MPAPTYVLQLRIHCSLRAVHTHRGKQRGGKETDAKLVTHHISESPLRTDFSHCMEKTLLAGDISRETAVETAIKSLFLITEEKAKIGWRTGR